MAETLAEMTGMDLESAQSLFEACGGDLETALAIALEGGGGMSSSSPKETMPPLDPDGIVFARSVTTVPDAWAVQELQSLASNDLNVLQPKNGPCGVLACIIAGVAVRRLSNGNQPIQSAIKDEELQQVVFDMLSRAATAVTACAVAKADDGSSAMKSSGPVFGGKAVQSWKEIPVQDVRKAGGVIKLVQSLVESRTPKRIREDVLRSGGELPLISGPNSLCSSELMSLMMRGTADGNFSAFHPESGEIVKDEEWSSCGFGMITRGSGGSTAEAPLANALMFPRLPVWIVHGGDHFTELIEIDHAKQLFLHLNGLPPAGPCTSLINIRSSVSARRITSAETQPNRYIKPVKGEIDEIVQAHPDDKKIFKDDWKRWRVEVTLAVDDDTVKDDLKTESKQLRRHLFEPRDPPKNPGDTWRCASCYRDRFRTMNFGQQALSADRRCQFCGKSLEEAGWSMWFSYAELPRDIQMRIDRMFAPKLLNVLRTRWPDADVHVMDKAADKILENAPLPST